MQRPTTSGRRHNRAGSVSVAELIRKQPAPLRIPSREQAATQGFVDDLLGEGEPVPRRASRAAKAAGIVTGMLVLLASVCAASILAGNRDAGPARPRVEPPPEISGSSALRPDVLSAELGQAEAVSPLAAHPAVSPLAADDPIAPPEVVAPQEFATGPKPQVDVVRRFFELLPSKPNAASQLLSPQLVGGSAQEFVAAWSRIQAVTIEQTVLRPDGAVLAVVAMQERTGEWMRLEQLFWLTDTTTPRIVGTQVLSAQRS